MLYVQQINGNMENQLENVLKTQNQLGKELGNGKNTLMGNGDVFIMTPTVNEIAKKEATIKFNQQVEEARADWDAKISEQEEHAKEMEEKMKDLQIVPINSYVLVQPYAKNPFQKMRVTESGLIIPEYTGVFKNPDSGMEDQEENLSVQALVIEVSPLCKFVKEGDIVYYRRACGVPIPFFNQGFEVVAEQQIQVVVNSGLKDRYSKEFKNENV